MTDVVLISGLMRVVAQLARSAEFGGRGAAISSALALAATAVERGDAGRVELKALKAHVEALASEGRAPTDEEFALIKAKSDAAHAIIQQPLEVDTQEPTKE